MPTEQAPPFLVDAVRASASKMQGMKTALDARAKELDALKAQLDSERQDLEKRAARLEGERQAIEGERERRSGPLARPWTKTSPRSEPTGRISRPNRHDSRMRRTTWRHVRRL